jgi:hypothetical protein
MTRTRTILAALVCIGAAQSNAPSNDLPQPYRTTRDWGELPPGGEVGGRSRRSSPRPTAASM